ncbi:4Fe-4S dicluster domain-containing protein [Mesobacillus maritimus]|uniref:4Fe-4S dicluster domain-containing protein n=1 Tax=Mesobacillus maritimus TaxID=1643336 RepID=UPI00384DB5B8
MTNRVNRRQFLSLNLDASVGFLGNLFFSQVETDRYFFRPPGAGDEVAFLTSCTRCGVCKEACPEDSISLFSIKSGAKLARTPFLNPNVSPCTMCGKCIDACEAGALTTSLASGGKSKRIGRAEVQQGHCLTFKGILCEYCIRACPEEGALAVSNGKLVVNTQNCTGCGLCVSSCISESAGVWVKN